MNTLVELFHAAGIVGPILAVCTITQWWALGARAYTLRGVSAHAADRAASGEASPHTLLGSAYQACMHTRSTYARPSRAHYEAALTPFHALAEAHATMVRSVVAVAPLAGLLGTVTGMIETFDSLGTMSMFTRNGGIGAGISEAMISTQMGLVVAVPGLLLGGLLDRRQTIAEDELDRLVERMLQGEAA